jgi:thiol-disulfide isomerase/thioredoxin
MKRLLLLAFVLAFASTADAQYTRRVLMEEFTNSGCPPCATTDPVIEAFEDEHLNDIAVLKYHVSWPDPNDPFYVAQKAADEANSRGQKYYGVTGVPAVFFGGLENPWPLTDATLTAAMEAVQGTSPFKIDITQKVEGDSVKAWVTVTAGPELPSVTDLQLATVFAERWNPYHGTNGRTFHTSIVRKVMPGVSKTNGQLTAAANITIAANETKTFYYASKLGATWVEDQMMTVAYIQSNGSKEVYQSNWTVPSITSVASTEGTVVIPGLDGTTISLENKNLTSAVRVKVALDAGTKPANWTVELLGADASGIVELEANEAKQIMLNVTAPEGQAKGSMSGKINIHEVDANGNIISALKGAEASFFGADNTEVYVDAGGGMANFAAVNSGMASSGLEMGAIDRATFLDKFYDWSQFKYIYLNAGAGVGLYVDDGSWDLLADYVENGGNFIMAAPRSVGIMYNSGEEEYMDLYRNVFHIEPRAFATTTWSKLIGKPGDAIGDGINMTMDATYAMRQPLRGTDAAFNSVLMSERKDTVASRAITGEGKVVYLSFDLGHLNESDRTLLSEKIITWFNSTASVKTSDVATSNKLSNYPNPFNPSTTIEFSITEAAPVTLVVKDMMGREVATLIDFQMHEKGTYSQAFDASELASGTYMYELTAGTTKITEKMILNK